MTEYCYGWAQDKDGKEGSCKYTGKRFSDQNAHCTDEEHRNYVATLECRNDQTCITCPTHWCCRIYNDRGQKGTRDLNMDFEEWSTGFHEHPETYGVKPLFDPLEVWMDGPEHDKQREELIARGIDPQYCQYYNLKSGCMIDRDKRPLHCRKFNCGEFTPADYVPLKLSGQHPQEDPQ